MKYGFRIVIVQDRPLDQKKMIAKILKTVSDECDDEAGIVIGPDEINTQEDLDTVKTNAGRNKW